MSENYNPSVKTKRSNVSGKLPQSTDLKVGQLAINFPDKKIYTKTPEDEIINLGATDLSLVVDDEKITFQNPPQTDQIINFSDIDHDKLKNYDPLEHHKMEWDNDIETYLITENTK